MAVAIEVPCAGLDDRSQDHAFCHLENSAAVVPIALAILCDRAARAFVKFSVLLPTRDRLELLRLAVTSVLAQDSDDWEIVVSDNASKEDIRGYITSLNDARIRYVRSDEPLAVTDNWNNALRHSKGDYVIMLGDDDALALGCLARLALVIEQQRDPDVLYFDTLQYAYPNVFPDHPSPFVRRGYTAFLQDPTVCAPFLLDRDRARQLVRASMSFRIAFAFNMQHYAISRRMIEELSRGGDFFRSPYPDYYAANALMLEARTIVAVPASLVVIGISPRSFGYFFVNNRDDAGDAFLANVPDPQLRERLREVVLPGTTLLTSWLYAMETLRAAIPSARELPIDYDRYRILQVHAMFKREGVAGVRRLLPRLTLKEIATSGVLGGLLTLVRIAPTRLAEPLYGRVRDWIGLNPNFDPQIRDVPFRNILELIESL